MALIEQVHDYLFIEWSILCFVESNEHPIFQIEVAFSKYDVTGDDMLNYKEFCEMINNKNE